MSVIFFQHSLKRQSHFRPAGSFRNAAIITLSDGCTLRIRGARRRGQKTGVFNVWKQGKCERKSVCIVRDKKKCMASECMEKCVFVFLDSGPLCKQENRCFNQTMLYLLIESGNNRSVERGFPNSGCFHCWNVNCAAETLEHMPKWSGNPDDLRTYYKRRSLKPP